MQIAQSWDDGVINDLRLVEILRKYGVPATFNLNPSLHKNQRHSYCTYGGKPVWRFSKFELPAVYEGFEIANHSATHCVLTDNMSTMQLWYEITNSRLILQDWFSKQISGFCYPFGKLSFKIKYLVKSSGHTYARTTCNTKKLRIFDPYELNITCNFCAPNFWDIYEQTKLADNGSFLFWGHSYEIINNQMWSELENKIARITLDPEVNWVNTRDLVASNPI